MRHVPAERRPRTAAQDVVAQALWAVRGRPTRSLLTALGVSLGVAATLATLGITASSAAAISDRFDATRATMVTVRYPDTLVRPDQEVIGGVRSLNGVVAAGFMCSATEERRLTTVDSRIADAVGERVNVHAVQPSALEALGVGLVTGRVFDDGHERRGDRVALVDTVAAESLGVIDVANHPLIYLDGEAYTAIGIIRASTGEAGLTAAAVVPYQECRRTPAAYRPTEAVIRTQLGAADQIGGEAPLALRPEDPASLTVLVPPDLRTFRRGVEQETRSLFLALAGVCLFVGAIGVSNTMLVAVLERRSEVGLRRAVGASRRAVAGQFLVESAILGAGGGLLGTVVAIDVTAVVCLYHGWLVVLDPLLVAVTPVAGVVVGMLAGLYPAWVAARIEPATTLRG